MPIFNAEKFLDESLGGVLKQSLHEIEVICVNDGSTDNSLKKIHKFASADSRIRIIDKKNKGYGQTMNMGLKEAKGEYIAILEPDDFVDIEMYEYLYTKAKDLNLDVAKSNYFEYYSTQGKNNYFEVLKGLPYEKVTNANEEIGIIHMRPCIWSAIYKRRFLLDNHIVFNETPGASYQDTSFAFKVWVCAERVAFFEKAFLHYRMDNESSSVNSTGKIFSICDEFSAMQAFLNQNCERRAYFSSILQLLKLDAYTWNLGRITEEYKSLFENQMALEFIKAEYEGFLKQELFDPARWNSVRQLINKYKNNDNNKKGKNFWRRMLER